MERPNWPKQKFKDAFKLAAQEAGHGGPTLNKLIAHAEDLGATAVANKLVADSYIERKLQKGYQKVLAAYVQEERLQKNVLPFLQLLQRVKPPARSDIANTLQAAFRSIEALAQQAAEAGDISKTAVC